MDSGARSQPDDSRLAGDELSPPRWTAEEPVATRRPRPDGPNMDVYRSNGCDAALKSVAVDDSISPRTRSLAGEVLGCRGDNGHYDLRHAPCPIFGSNDDDRLVDVAIQELRAMAPACDAPPG